VIGFHGSSIHLCHVHRLLTAIMKEHGHVLYEYDTPLKDYDDLDARSADVSQGIFNVRKRNAYPLALQQC
jgi:hypothetical protein